LYWIDSDVLVKLALRRNAYVVCCWDCRCEAMSKGAPSAHAFHCSAETRASRFGGAFGGIQAIRATVGRCLVGLVADMIKKRKIWLTWRLDCTVEQQ
jgi:hypothetical protein